MARLTRLLAYSAATCAWVCTFMLTSSSGDFVSSSMPQLFTHSYVRSISSAGIGYYTQVFSETFNPAPLFALISVLAAMAIFLNEIVRLAERRFTRWKE